MNSPLNNRLLEVEQNTSPAVLILLDADGDPIAFNRAARQLLQVSDSVKWSQLLHPEDANLWLSEISSSLEKQIPISGWFRLRRFDNAFRQFVLRAEPRYDHTGTYFGHHVSGLDVSGISGATASSETALSHSAVKNSPQSTELNERRAIAKEWHDELVNEVTIIGISTDVLLELVNNMPDNREILDVVQRTKNSAAKMCDRLNRLNQISREA